MRRFMCCSCAKLETTIWESICVSYQGIKRVIRWDTISHTVTSSNTLIILLLRGLISYRTMRRESHLVSHYIFPDVQRVSRFSVNSDTIQLVREGFVQYLPFAPSSPYQSHGRPSSSCISVDNYRPFPHGILHSDGCHIRCLKFCPNPVNLRLEIL